jgi:hypothetical protein
MKAQRFTQLPFSGAYNSRRASTTKDERYINCFFTETGGRKYIVKRPGWATNTTPAAGSIGTAILVWSSQGTGSKIISAFGGTNSTIYDGTTSLGAITGKATGIAEFFISSTPTIGISSSDSTGWYYDAGATVAVPTKIADADFPGNAGKTLAGTFCNIDGYTLICTTDNKLWASDINSITAWTANNYGATNAYPDPTVGAIRVKNQILVFGTQSLEFWYNAGLTPFAFARSEAATVKIGACSADAITQISDVAFWCGSAPEGGLSVFQFGDSVTRISTPEVDQSLQTAGSGAISLSAIRIFGLSFVIVTYSSTNAWVYCLEDKRWHEWNSTVELWYKTTGASVGSGTMPIYAISKDSTSGKVFKIDPNSFVYQDNGGAYTATAQSGNDSGSNWKFYDELNIAADTESTTSTLNVYTSDDDYATWVLWDSRDLSGNMPKLTRGGSSQRRAWKFTHADNTAFRIKIDEPMLLMRVGLY